MRIPRHCLCFLALKECREHLMGELDRLVRTCLRRRKIRLAIFDIRRAFHLRAVRRVCAGALVFFVKALTLFHTQLLPLLRGKGKLPTCSKSANHLEVIRVKLLRLWQRPNARTICWGGLRLKVTMSMVTLVVRHVRPRSSRRRRLSHSSSHVVGCQVGSNSMSL